jgi:hypothetical protein
LERKIPLQTKILTMIASITGPTRFDTTADAPFCVYFNTTAPEFDGNSTLFDAGKAPEPKWEELLREPVPDLSYLHGRKQRSGFRSQNSFRRFVRRSAPRWSRQRWRSTTGHNRCAGRRRAYRPPARRPAHRYCTE